MSLANDSTTLPTGLPTHPVIAFCTTCKGRTQHLELTLPKNLADNHDYPHTKFIVLDYNSPDHLTQYLRSFPAHIESGQLTVYQSQAPGPFQMAHAKNMAHRCGILEGADILVNLDADNYTGQGFAHYIARKFRESEDIFLWAKMVRGEMTRGINGRIVVTRQEFLNVGGYDERYSTWSPDDKDFNLRLRRLGYRAEEIDPCYLHAVSHNDKMRFKEYKHVSAAGYGDNDQSETVHSSTTTVVNWGKIGCGTVYRNFDLGTPIELRPVPTRIFGIGMHKTATTSLHTALHILGVDSAHWKTAHWAKAIWMEMMEQGRSKTLERSYALSDLPITMLYKELDKAYPGSKFILTVRNEGSWLRSVENHWSHERNPFRHQWSNDPFTHKAHKILYGQKGFDAALFLARYRRHNDEVKEYFKDRPGDLLILDMDNGHGWPELCGFLGVPVPEVPYPKALVTR